jgi:hypothetical protein
MTINQYWKHPRYAKPKTTKIALRFQSISSIDFRSATTCAIKSAADVLTVATPSWNLNGFSFAQLELEEDELELEPALLLLFVPLGAIFVVACLAALAVVVVVVVVVDSVTGVADDLTDFKDEW